MKKSAPLADQSVALDRMRYTKNTFSSRMTYLAILFDVLFFVSIYESDVGSWYYRYIIGISVVYNLCFMLLAFLASEGVKSYKPGYAVLLMVLGVGQLVRIFVLPLSAFTTIREGVGLPVMELPQFIYVTVCLCLSALSCFVAGLVGIDRSRKLARYNASLANQPV